MPTARVTRSIALGDGRSYQPGDELTGDHAHEAVSGGWGELVREQRPETPEGTRAQRSPAPERRRTRRGEVEAR